MTSVASATAPTARTFYSKTVTLTFYADQPFEPDEEVSDLLERDSLYGTRSGCPPLTCLETTSETSTITSVDLAALLLDYECAVEEDCTRLHVFDLTATGEDAKA
jgi:hypothetical protein